MSCLKNSLQTVSFSEKVWLCFGIQYAKKKKNNQKNPHKNFQS